MINWSLLSFRNILVIAVITIFARSLLSGFVNMVDGQKDEGGE